MTAIHTGLTERITALAKGKNTEKGICYFPLYQVPDLVENIWNEVVSDANKESYNKMVWELPKNKKTLEEIVGQEPTEQIYLVDDTAKRNVDLRAILSVPLNHTSYEIRLKAINWVIFHWGGIGKGKEKHVIWAKQLDNYRPDTIQRFIIDNYFERISSWSKVLAFAKSEKYAIYDARVAMSLNAILDKLGYRQRFYMPSTRHKDIKATFPNIKEFVKHQYVGKNPTYIGYFDYMNLLNEFVNKKFVPNILEAEMRLFASAPEFAKEFAKKYNLQ